MNQKDENWDFDGEGHRGKRYPMGGAGWGCATWIVLATAIIIFIMCKGI